MSNDKSNANGIEYGKRSIPSLIDHLAATDPDHVFALVPKTSQFLDGLTDVTIGVLAKAIDRAAFWVESLVGKSHDSSVIAYLGPNDLRYMIIAIAARKVGYQTLLSSPRNSIEGHLSLLERSNCHTLINDSATKVDHILAKRPMRHYVVAPLQDFLDKGSLDRYEYNKSFEEDASDPFVVIHTSGSTGLPKPITIYLGALATVDAQHLMPNFEGYRPQIQVAQGPVCIFSGLPPFHIAGIMQSLACALYYNETVIWPPAARPMSVEVIDDLLDHVAVDFLFVAPSLLEELSQSSSSLKKLDKIKGVQTGGGPLSENAGNTITKHTDVLNVIGSSESCFAPIYHRDREDWIYFHFNPDLKGIQFRETGGGVYEQYFVRDPSTDAYHSLWYTFPDKHEVSTQDLFSKHPTKPNLWKYMGRSDDMLVFSNGEKYNPTAMEGTLRAHPEIIGAVVVGHARFQPAALIELKGDPPKSEEDKQKFFDSARPYVAKLNDEAPGFAKLRRTHVRFTHPDKPMIRADKGTVKRAATVKLYEKEIDKLYADAESSTSTESIVDLDAPDLDRMTKALRLMLIRTVGLQDLSVDEDIFTAGADSLQVMNLVRQLKLSLGGKEKGIPADLISSRIIYSNPTTSRLANALHSMAKQGTYDPQNLEQERIGKQEKMLAKYAKHNFNVVLSGSTGSLGSYLLDCLLASPRVSKVICLNRGTNSEERQKTVNISRSLNHDWNGRVTFLGIELGKPRLGLDEDKYELIVNEASVIIHNQWQVDFNLSLESFEPHIAGVRDLIDISSRSSNHPPILFTSSISTLGGWAIKHPGEKVPEEAFHDFTIPEAMGYAESKYVAERLLEEAGASYGVSSAICRVGQLAGPVKKSGVWSKQEWFPSLVASSKYLGKIPTSLPTMEGVPWVPVDLTARIIVELLLSDIDEASSSAWTRFHNIVNPRNGSWETLVPSIIEYLGKDQVEPVNFTTWLEALKESAAKAEDVKQNPAIKLLDWFEGMETHANDPVAELETAETQRRSETLRSLEAVGNEWMGIWLKQWQF